MNFIDRLRTFNRERVLFIIALVGCAAVGFLIGAIVFRGMEGEAIDTAKSGERSVLPTTRVSWEFKFACGHDESYVGPRDVLGLTEAQIKERYSGAQVLEMTGESTIISLEVDELCPEHYLLILAESDTLAVMRTNINTLDAMQMALIPISLESIDDETAAELAAGKVFDSLSEIDAYVEGIES